MSISSLNLTSGQTCLRIPSAMSRRPSGSDLYTGPAADAPQAAVLAPAARGLRACWRQGADATPLLPGYTQIGRAFPEIFDILDGFAGGPGVSRPKLLARRALVLALVLPAAAVADAAAFLTYPARVIASVIKIHRDSKASI